MRVTQKGQVTIPKDVRDRLKIGPGSEVDFVLSDEGAMLVKTGEGHPDFESFADWAKSVEGMFDIGGMTTDEYMLWLRGPRDDLDRG